MMKIVVDKYIPFLDGVLEAVADVTVADPAQITAEAVRDADALLVRTRTRVDDRLLGGSRCTFVGTATIGMDHIDTIWCKNAGITAVNAPGCNAPAVAQYIMSAICSLADRPLADLTLGIVGVGRVGSIVERWASGLGMRVMAVDPPRHSAGHEGRWYTLGDVAREADIITFHTPLTHHGADATYHLAGRDFFGSLKRRPIVINSSRGSVVDNEAWVKAITDGQVSHSVVDVWEGEPRFNHHLLEAADIVTPHIAGYSRDGKIRATQMVLDALSAHFGLPQLKANAPVPCLVPEKVTEGHIKASYDILADSDMMRRAMAKSDDTARTFESLRDNYKLRNEISLTQA